MTLALHLLEKSKEIEDLLSDVEAMEEMVDEFLEFVKGNAGEALAITDPVGIARSVVNASGGDGLAIGLDVASGVPDDLFVSLRPRAIHRALTNLVENSRKFAHSATLRIECLPDEIRYVLEDDGPGIPKEFRKEAVRPFTRLDRSRGQNDGGGVGLGAVNRSGRSDRTRRFAGIGFESQPRRAQGGTRSTGLTQFVERISRRFPVRGIIVPRAFLDGRPGGTRTPNQAL